MTQYNLKAVDYGEFVQYRIYDRTIIKNKNNGNEKIENDIWEGEECPFDGVSLRDLTVLKDESDEYETKKKKEHSENVSINRTVQTIYKYAQANCWDWFVTLTFKRDGRIDAYSYDAVVKKLTKWLNNQRKKAPDLRYLFVPEMHKDGAWHFHGLMADCEGLTFVDSGRVAIGNKAYERTEENADYPTIYNMDNWKNGFSTATKIQNSCKASSYICKYITKDVIQHTGRRRRFYPSNNLALPVETEHLFTADDVKQFMDDISNKIDYIKTQIITDARQRVTYITVRK